MPVLNLLENVFCSPQGKNAPRGRKHRRNVGQEDRLFTKRIPFMFSRSIRTSMLLVISLVVLAVQSALVVVVTRMGDEANLAARTHEMDLVADTIAKSLGDFGTQLGMFVNGASKPPRLREFLLRARIKKARKFFWPPCRRQRQR